MAYVKSSESAEISASAALAVIIRWRATRVHIYPPRGHCAATTRSS